MEIAYKIDFQEFVAISLYGLARVASAKGEIAEARLQGEESLKTFETIGHTKAVEVRQWLEEL